MKQKKHGNWYSWLEGTHAINVNVETTDKVAFERHDLRREGSGGGGKGPEVIDRRATQSQAIGGLSRN